MLRAHLAVVVSLVGISAVHLPAGRAAPLAAQRTNTIDASSAFGFEVGEERRYMLGPPEALDPGEFATWLIRLDRIRDEGEAVFVLGHHRQGPHYTTGTPAYGEELEAEMEGELTVNAYGFPLSLSFNVQRQVYGGVAESYHVHYRFDGRTYLKEAQADGNQWEISIPMMSHKHLDKSVPIGLYLFLPDAFHCVGFRPSIRRTEKMHIPRPTAGQGLPNAPPPPQSYRIARTCESDTDLAFLNPGLLSIAWPILLEDGEGQRDYLFFTPTGADLRPGFQGSGISTGLGQATVAARAGHGGSSIGHARDPRRYYSFSRIRLLETTTLTLRGRTLQATAARIDGVPGLTYFDEGKVLRVDIDHNLMTMVDGLGVNIDPDAFEDRWVRLMFPSEY